MTQPAQSERVMDSTQSAESVAMSEAVEAVAELQLVAYLAGVGSVVAIRDGTRTAKPCPSMDDFRNMARKALGAQVQS